MASPNRDSSNPEPEKDTEIPQLLQILMLTFLSGWYALLILSRRNLGADVLGVRSLLGTLLFASLTIRGFNGLYAQDASPPALVTNISEGFISLLVIVGLIRLMEVKHKELNYIPAHSLSHGESYGFWRAIPILKDFPSFTRRHIEPLCWLLLAGLCDVLEHNGLALYLFGSSILFWFIEERSHRYQTRLDRLSVNAKLSRNQSLNRQR